MHVILAAALGGLIVLGLAALLRRTPQGMRNFFSLAGGLLGLFAFMFVIMGILFGEQHRPLAPGELFWAALGVSWMMLGAAWCAIRSAMRLMILSRWVDRAMAEPAPTPGPHLR